MKDQVRVAVIGYGHLGKWHCEKTELMDKARLVAIVDQREEQLQLAKQKHPNARVEKHLLKILPEVDACILVTPTSTHFELLKLLISHHKHVFCEKPLCDTEEEADQVAGLLQGKNLVIQVGHSERCHEIWEILTRTHGEILKAPGVVRLDRLGPFKGRATDVDVVSDLMIHDLDLLVYLFREVPLSVTAQGFKEITSKWDFVSCQLTFPSGRVAFLTSHRNDVREVRTFQFTSSHGHMHVDLLAREFSFLGKEGNLKSTYAPRDHLLLEQKAFFEAILGKTRPMVTFEDGHLAVQLVSNVLTSLKTGKTLWRTPHA